jgi:hypothetical protein
MVAGDRCLAPAGDGDRGSIQALEQAQNDVHTRAAVRFASPRHGDGSDLDPRRANEEGERDEVVGRDIGVDEERQWPPRAEAGTGSNGALSRGRRVGRGRAWSATADHGKDAEGQGQHPASGPHRGPPQTAASEQ